MPFDQEDRQMLNDCKASFKYEVLTVHMKAGNSLQDAHDTREAINALLMDLSADPLHYILDVTVTDKLEPDHILYRARINLRSDEEPIIFDLAKGAFERVMAA